MMEKILIVDDEFPARILLQDYVKRDGTLELVDSCDDALKALEILKSTHIDIILLDIQMPELTGIELIKMLEYQPAIILTTAYTEYAIDAFDLGVTDYLLKPFSYERFEQAIRRAKDDLKRPKYESTPSETPDFIMVKADYKFYKIKFEDLLYIEGQHEYVSFHTTEKRITAFYSLKKLEEILPSDKFFRIHKSFIISLKEIEVFDKQHVSIRGQKIPIGANFREALMRKLQY